MDGPINYNAGWDEVDENTTDEVEVFAFALPTWGLHSVLKENTEETIGDLSEAKEADFIKVFCQVMHIINVVLAPEVSVIYQDLISSETLSKEWADYCQRNEMPSTPFLTFSNEFHTDFYEGVKLNTLKRIIYQIEKV